jgi:tetratricopeptide (TPR) repeat protein
MPLAIELAATWTRLLDPPAILDRIRASIDFLSTNLRDLPERQRSMRAVFDYMWQSLSPPEREALAMLSVLRGPFRLDAAEAITGASPEVLALLLDQSLLRAAGGGRFELHELLRQYAVVKLGADPSLVSMAHERHAAHYLAMLESRGGMLGGPESKAALAALLRNHDNVRAAWDWVVAAGRLDALERCAPSLEAFYRHSGLSAEGAEALAASVTSLERQAEAGSAALVFPVINDLLRRAAMLLELHGDGDEAVACLERARAGWQALGDHTQLVRVLCDEAYVKLRRFKFDEVREVLETALALARELGDHSLIAAALHNQGNAAAWSGDIERGRPLLEESLDHYRAAGEMNWLAGTLNDLGMTYAFEGNVEDARAYFRRSLSISEISGDQPGIAMAAANLGAIALDEGDMEESERFSRRGQSTAQDIGDKLMLSVSLGNLGHAALARGERQAAMRYYRHTAALTRESGYTYMLIEAVLGLAALVVDDDPAASAQWLAAVAAWRLASGFTLETPFIRDLRRQTEARQRAVLGDQFDALGAKGAALPITTAAAEATAWAMGVELIV